MNYGSDRPDHRRVLTGVWRSDPSDDLVFINQSTGQQVERHYVRFTTSEVKRQLQVYNARMQLPSQSICKLLWYQPITEENRGDHVRHHSQDTHEYYVYTERMLPVASAVWSKDKIINILQAFDLLLTEYGCFRISEKMICQNEKKELRLWINEQPARNRPQRECRSEDITMNDLLLIIAVKNPDIVHLIEGARTIKQALDMLTKCKANMTSFQNNQVYIESERNRFNYNRHPNNFQPGATAKAKFTQSRSIVEFERSPKMLTRKHEGNQAQHEQIFKQKVVPQNYNRLKEILDPMRIHSPTRNRSTPKFLLTKQAVPYSQFNRKVKNASLNVNANTNDQPQNNADTSVNSMNYTTTMYYNPSIQNIQDNRWIDMSVNSSTSTVSNNVQSQQSFSPFDANPFISYTGMKNQQIIDMHSKVNFNSDNNISNTAGKPNTIIQKTREKTPLSSESDSAQYAGSHVGHTSSKNTEENKMGVNLRQLLSLDSPGQIRIDHINGMKPNNPFNNTAPQGMSMSIAQQKPQLEKQSNNLGYYHLTSEIELKLIKAKSGVQNASLNNLVAEITNVATRAANYKKLLATTAPDQTPKRQKYIKTKVSEKSQKSNLPLFIKQKRRQSGSLTKQAQLSNELCDQQSQNYQPPQAGRNNVNVNSNQQHFQTYTSIAGKDKERKRLYKQANPFTKPYEMTVRDGTDIFSDGHDIRQLELCFPKTAVAASQNQLKFASRTKTTEFGPNCSKNFYEQRSMVANRRESNLIFNNRSFKMVEDNAVNSIQKNNDSVKKYNLRNPKAPKYILFEKERIQEDANENFSTIKSIEQLPKCDIGRLSGLPTRQRQNAFEAIQRQRYAKSPDTKNRQKQIDNAAQAKHQSKMQLKKQLKSQFSFLLQEPTKPQNEQVSKDNTLNGLSVQKLHKNQLGHSNVSDKESDNNRCYEQKLHAIQSPRMKYDNEFSDAEKSMKQKTIREKVEKKKAAFAQLKLDVIKVLNDNFL